MPHYRSVAAVALLRPRQAALFFWNSVLSLAALVQCTRPQNSVSGKLADLRTHLSCANYLTPGHRSSRRARRPLKMKKFNSRVLMGLVGLLVSSFALSQTSNQPSNIGSNKVLGEVQLLGAGDTEKNAGVWVDGQYLGYLKELKGSKKILLIPGEHDIAVREDGYHDFPRKSPFGAEKNRQLR